MKIKNKIKLILLMSFILLGALSMKCFATSISVSPSKKTVAPGESFSVTISGSDATGRVNISASNGSVSPSSAWIENSSVTVTVKAGSSGTVTVSASGELSSNSGVDKKVSGSTSVSIQSSSNSGSGNAGGTNTKPNTNNGSTSSGNQGGGTVNNNNNSSSQAKDSNANLSNLGIRPNDFSGFNAGKTSYSVNVPNNVASIEVYAKASSSKSKVSGTGIKNLQPGTNKFSVVVTAENGNSKTYTISVNRAGESGEIIENHNDEERPEEKSVGVGLSTLVIEGLELDKEFKTDVYEYKVIVKEDLTLEDLEKLKEKIIADTNSDKVYKEVIAEISEDGKRVITIIVKDDEKEYSRYVITFEKEEEKEPEAVLMTEDSDKDASERSGFTLNPEQKVYILLACFGITFLMAVYFASVSFIKSKRLAEYEETGYEANEDINVDNMNEYYVGAEKMPNMEEYSTDNVPDVTTKVGKGNGYRSMRNGTKSEGRHF